MLTVSIHISLCLLLFFFSILRRPPISTLFPYTTLFRSHWPILTHTAIALMWCFIVAFDRHCGQAFCPLSPQLIEAINYPDRPRQLLPAFLSSRTGPCPLRTAGSQ